MIAIPASQIGVSENSLARWTMKTEKEPIQVGQEKLPSVRLLDNHMELFLDGTLFRVSCEFSNSGHLPDLLDTFILEKISRGG